MRRKLIVLLHLLVAEFLIDSHKCHQISSATSCVIVNLTKFSDSACKHEVVQTVEDQYGYEIMHLNGMIVSGECHAIDSAYSDDIKLRVDCMYGSSVRFRYYNFFGGDEACLEEPSTRKSTTIQSELTTMITAHDNACAPMSDGVFYKFRIEPLIAQTEFKRRKMQGDAAQTIYPQQAFYQNPWPPYQPGPEINSPNPVANPEEVWAIPPIQNQPTVYPQTVVNQPNVLPQTIVHQPNVLPSTIVQQPIVHPQTIVHGQQPLIQQIHHQFPVQEEAPKRDKVIDRIYDAGIAIRDFSNQALDITGDYVGNRVGTTYDYVGDVGSYANARKNRQIFTAANSPQYSAQMKEMDESSELSIGAIIGIIAGSVCFLLLIVASICYFALDNSKWRGFNRSNETQMGNVQNGPNFDNGNETDDNFGNNDQTFNVTVTHGQQQNANQKEGDLTYGTYLAGY